MDNVFGQPEEIQQENVQNEGSNPTLIAILLILIFGGGATLGFLLYRQSQEPPIGLDEVVETVELPAPATTTTPTTVPETVTTPESTPAQ
jgi:hypothetical protein